MRVCACAAALVFLPACAVQQGPRLATNGKCWSDVCRKTRCSAMQQLLPTCSSADVQRCYRLGAGGQAGARGACGTKWHLVCRVDAGAPFEQVLHHLEMPVLGRLDKAGPTVLCATHVSYTYI